MPPIKTILVDDSAFVRKVVREMLAASPAIEVIGMARNGNDALEVVAELKPDVVICDLHMPDLDGVGFIRRQMKSAPIPILILTASPQDGAVMLEALEAGAVDFVQKPSALANEALLQIRDELIEKVTAAAQTPKRALQPQKTVKKDIVEESFKKSSNRFDIVVLGISTGGPQALRYMLPQFPKDFSLPLVMVLHMPVGYTALFAEKLADISQLPVKEAFEDCPVVPRQALLAPAGKHLSFKRTIKGNVLVHLSSQPTNKPHRPAVDVLFQSAANVYGARVLGVVMTGMGDDGREGSAWIKAQGGMVLTESEESCIIYGMPRSVIEAGLSDEAVSLTSMVTNICNKV